MKIGRNTLQQDQLSCPFHKLHLCIEDQHQVRRKQRKMYRVSYVDGKQDTLMPLKIRHQQQIRRDLTKKRGTCALLLCIPRKEATCSC